MAMNFWESEKILKKQNALPGQISILEREGQYLYNLVAKKGQKDKATYDNLRQFIYEWKIILTITVFDSFHYDHKIAWCMLKT